MFGLQILRKQESRFLSSMTERKKETYTSSSRHELDQLMQEKHENLSGQTYSFL